MSTLPQITGIGIATIFAADYATSFAFYHELLELSDVTTMNEHSCYFRLNDSQGIYLVGGFTAVESAPKSCRTTFALDVRSISETFGILKSAGVRMVHDEPMQMNDTDYWFQCYDPSGLLIEFIGKK